MGESYRISFCSCKNCQNSVTIRIYVSEMRINCAGESGIVYRILIVDDESRMRKLIKDFLVAKGYVFTNLTAV